jgi:hypothetical protein
MDRPKVCDAFRSAVTEVMMAFRNKIYFIILGIIVQLLFFGDVKADERQPSDKAAEQRIVTAPEQHDMTLVSFQPWVVEGEVWGSVAAYVHDDVSTERPADYWEVSDKQGNLLAFRWFDRFGIQRTAVDRGIIEQKDKLAGVFVVVLDGNAI